MRRSAAPRGGAHQRGADVSLGVGEVVIEGASLAEACDALGDRGGEREHLVERRRGMRSALDADIEEHGEHATLPYGERFRVELVREGDVWCVADPD